MSTETAILPNDSEPAVKPYMVECKFTVEHRESTGGDWERNTGGATSEKRVTFDGYATDALCDALMASIKVVLSDDRD